MNEDTIKVACSVIDGWTHYKGRVLNFKRGKAVISIIEKNVRKSIEQ